MASQAAEVLIGAAAIVGRNTEMPKRAKDAKGNVCVIHAIRECERDSCFVVWRTIEAALDAAVKARSGHGLIDYQESLTPAEASAFLLAVSKEV